MVDAYYYETFYLNTILIIVFIIGILLSIKYETYKKHIGTILTIIGITEILHFTTVLIYFNTQIFTQFNPTSFVFVLGCITLVGGVSILKQIKRVWMLILIIMAILQFLWTVVYYFT